VKLPTIWTDGKAEAGRARRKKKAREKAEKSRDPMFSNGLSPRRVEK
jgi:hypothetical protein